MDINLLTVNVGNSRLGLGVFVQGKLEYTVRVPLSQPESLAGKIADAWERIEALDQPAVAGASVNPSADQRIDQLIATRTGQPVQWVGREIDLPIKVKTDVPSQTGVDRVLNIAAAYEQMQKACVVVDAGSAITVDLCNDAGEFIGGAIAPGASMMLETLHQRIPTLPAVTLAAPTGLVGRSTEQAILHGVYHGLRGLTKELVENYATELGNWPDIIATGGDAQTLFGDWELVHAVAPDLIFYGIALAYVNHHIKHES